MPRQRDDENAPFVPNEAEVQRLAAEIREGWTDDRFRKACGESKREPFEVPEVATPVFGGKVI